MSYTVTQQRKIVPFFFRDTTQSVNHPTGEATTTFSRNHEVHAYPNSAPKNSAIIMLTKNSKIDTHTVLLRSKHTVM